MSYICHICRLWIRKSMCDLLRLQTCKPLAWLLHKTFLYWISFSMFLDWAMWASLMDRPLTGKRLVRLLVKRLPADINETYVNCTKCLIFVMFFDFVGYLCCLQWKIIKLSCICHIRRLWISKSLCDLLGLQTCRPLEWLLLKISCSNFLHWMMCAS